MPTKIIIGDIMLVADTDENEKLMLPFRLKPQEIEMEIRKLDEQLILFLWHEDKEIFSVSVKSNKVGIKYGSIE